VLVHGATGGLASTFPAVARSLGATRVIGTVGSTGKVQAARELGLDPVMLTDKFLAALGDERSTSCSTPSAARCASRVSMCSPRSAGCSS
jgi:hypothetical protein